MATDADTDIEVSRADFLNALKELVPSVSQTEMEHYRQVQRRFAEGVDKDGNPSKMSNKQTEDEGMVLGPITKDRKGKGRAAD